MTRKLSASIGRNGGQPIDNEPDVVDPIPDVAKRWSLSVDSIYRAAKRGELKITKLGPRRQGLRRSEQRRFLDKHTG
jgi:predicted DNA-binding transcriptional regulator AlpA